MTDDAIRSVVTAIKDRHVSLNERDRLGTSEELLHLCKSYRSLKHAAYTADESDVWNQLDTVEQIINKRLENMEWED